MKIIQFTAENIKKLKVVSIKPDGSLVLITGANAQGKSSVLDAIYMAMGGTQAVPSQPVRHGEEKAYVKLDLGELVVTRKFTANGGTTLTVQSADGAKFNSPQTVLDALLGSLTFDPLEFSRMQPKQQLETLRGLVKLDVDIDALDVKTKLAYDERTAVNREIKTLKAKLPTIPEGTPSEEVSVGKLVSSLSHANATNNERKSSEAMLNRINYEILEKNQEIERLRNQIDDIQRKLSELNQSKAEIHIPDAVDAVAIRLELESAEATNSKVRILKEHQKLTSEINGRVKQAEDLDTVIENHARIRRNAIASAKYPVDGLMFGDGEVVYNGVPFAQCSGAEQLKISLSIAMEANPKLRVIRIKDGSLLDESNLALVECMAAEKDFQVWIERVDTSGTVGIVIEDGSVVSA